MLPSLAIVIVNYNVRHFLQQCLVSVLRASEGSIVEIYVVDNNSTDGSEEMFQECFADTPIQWIGNKTNTGFSVANNQAIRLTAADYVLLLNPDTIVAEDTFQKCLTFLSKNPQIGGLGVRMIDGSGTFLPESKRGFPTPWVAFCKAFGLAALFPRSKRFNRYTMGHISEHQTAQVDVLAGAFMLMKKEALDKVELLDEAFFMYGEDIDLSYRLTLSGYENYYFADTTLLHYKGESTKRGSLNYVRTFYQAMIIFAKKHFQGTQVFLLVALMQMAIWFRASLTVFSNWFKAWYLPLLDTLGMVVGLTLLKNFWAIYYFQNTKYYDETLFLSVNLPLYISIWLFGVYLSGGYDRPLSIGRFLRGLLVGTVLLAAIYGFLSMAFRSSRALIALGAVWVSLWGVVGRWVVNFWQTGHIQVHSETVNNLLIIGSETESIRARKLLDDARIFNKNYITTLPNLSDWAVLEQYIRIFQIQEIIFCLQDLDIKEVLAFMGTHKNKIAYKTLPAGMETIIGSSDKNSVGELYTVDTRFQIATLANRRNKRLFDLSICLFLPLLLVFSAKKNLFLKNYLSVLKGKKTWIGYANSNLPALLPSVFMASGSHEVDKTLQAKIHFFYAKDYTIWEDVRRFWAIFI